MDLYHMTPSGDVKPCRARRGKCPYEGDDKVVTHLNAPSIEEAARKFEIHVLKSLPFEKTSFVGAVTPDSTDPYAIVRSPSTARAMLLRIAEEEERQGKGLEEVSLHLSYKPFEEVAEINLSRTKANHEGGSATFHWEAERSSGYGNHSVTLQISPDDYLDKLSGDRDPTLHHRSTELFLNRDYPESTNSTLRGDDSGMEFSNRSDLLLPSSVRKEVEAERRAEIEHYLHQTMMAVEGSIALGQNPRKKSLLSVSSGVKTGFLPKDDESNFSGNVNYASSGWRPEFLQNADGGETELSRLEDTIRYNEINLRNSPENVGPTVEQRKKDLISYGQKGTMGFSDTMTFYEKTTGDGAAGWKMVRKDGLWEVRLTGTRGVKKTIRSSSPEEVARLAEEFMEKHHKPRNLKKDARQLNVKTEVVEALNHRDSSKESQIKNRSSFFSKLVDETNRLEARVASNRQKILAAEEQEEEQLSQAKVRIAEATAPRRRGFFR